MQTCFIIIAVRIAVVLLTPERLNDNNKISRCDCVSFCLLWVFIIKGRVYWIHWTTKCPRTSIGEISSTFYAEFRYVYRILLSGIVSKIQGALFVQNCTLRTNETGWDLPLKCRGVWLSPVIGLRYIPLRCPAIFCQSTWCPLDLIPLFHSQNILVKSSTVFVTDFVEILWKKKSKWLSKKWIFRLILHPITLCEVD